MCVNSPPRALQDNYLQHIFDYLHCTPLFDEVDPGMVRLNLPSDTTITSIECNHLPGLGLGSEADDELKPGMIVRCALLLLREEVAITDETQNQERSWRMIWKLQATHLCRCYCSRLTSLGAEHDAATATSSDHIPSTGNPPADNQLANETPTTHPSVDNPVAGNTSAASTACNGHVGEHASTSAHSQPTATRLGSEVAAETDEDAMESASPARNSHASSVYSQQTRDDEEEDIFRRALQVNAFPEEDDLQEEDIDYMMSGVPPGDQDTMSTSSDE
uniref:Uncharacterized protein n=1 Tax=Mycena chlorophos TaxID=658473 RepID=A0ABQ0LFG3_MYCCL|nr:predicted protein [Mycena chlorophos]